MPDDNPQDHRTGQSLTPQNHQPGTLAMPTATSQPLAEPASNTSADRVDLLTRARTFLASPQVQLQDSDAKRAFLVEKGLTLSEVDQLLRELPPSVPPRTYPATPPSNFPNLLAGVVRIFSWLTGTSTILLFVYYSFFLPRLAQSYKARLALRKHQSALFGRLAESVSALKATQAESYRDLPRTIPTYEDPKYAQCHAIDELVSESLREESSQPGANVPDITILRCALEELGHTKSEGASTEELFRYLESKLPWLASEGGAARQNNLWNQLNSFPLFVASVPKFNAASSLPLDHPSRLLWRYVPSSPPLTPPLFASLGNLQAALRQNNEPVFTASDSTAPVPTVSARQRTLQALSDFTGYITTQTYSFTFPSIRAINGVPSGGNPAEDELRREIRALKGLVLNRRSFLPSGRVPTFGSDSDV